MKEPGTTSAASLVLLWLAQITGLFFFLFHLVLFPMLDADFPALPPWEQHDVMLLILHPIPFVTVQAILTVVAIWHQKQHPPTLLNRIALVPNYLFAALMIFGLLLEALHIDLIPPQA